LWKKAGVDPAKVAILTEGVMKSMLLPKLNTIGVVGLILLFLYALGFGGYQGLPAQEPKTSKSSELNGKQEDMDKLVTSRANEFKGRDHQITVITTPLALPVDTRCQVQLKPETNDQREVVETVYDGKVAKVSDDGIALTVVSARRKVSSPSVVSRIPIVNRRSTTLGYAEPTGQDKNVWIPAVKIQSVKLARDGKLLP
jgi:hypothetical protein